MKLQLLKRDFKLFATVFFIAFGMNVINAQTAASATWALTSNGNVSTTGAITGSALAIGAGINNPTYNSTIGVSTGSWSNDASSAVSNEYYEYKVTPTSGNTFYINSIEGEHSRSSGNWQVDFNYSLDNFATSTSLGNLSINTSTSSGFTATGLNIIVPSGTTFSLRIYGYESDGNNRQYRNKAIVFGGVTCSNTLVTTQPVNKTLCEGNSFTLTSVFSNASSYQWYQNGVAISGATSASYTKSGAVTSDSGLYYVVAGNNCSGSVQSNTVTVAVNPNPTSVTATASSTTLCTGNSISLTSGGTSNSFTTVTLLDENFNAGTNSWTKTNSSSGGTVANAAWTLRANNYTSTSIYGATISSNDASQFYLSDSDMQGSGGTTATVLRSPSFSTVGLDSASLSFYHYYRDYNTSDSAKIEISTNGTSWTTLETFNSDQGASSGFALASYDLASYLGQATVYVRFKYDAVWGYYWAVDNVKVVGVDNTTTATYAWTSTPAGYTSSVKNPTGVSPIVNTSYNVKVTNSFGCFASASTATVVVSPTSVGGSVTGGTSVCSGSTSGLLTLSGNTGSVVRWESSVSPFSTWTTIANTNTTYTSGALTQTTQFRAVVQSGVCATANSTATTVTIGSTTWNGTSWSNGAPTSVTSAVMSGNYTSSSSLSACSLTVTNNSAVIISDGDSVTLNGALTVDAGSSFTLENNANLLQNGSTNLNSGAITVKRFSSALKRQDYALWSSPVAGQQLQSFSPGTLSNRFYTYDTSADQYAAVATPSATNFATATGYLIRMPNVFPTTATVWTDGAFVGVPNSGDYGITMTDGGSGLRFNAVGNPYPSPIDAIAFVNNTTNAANTTGTLYFWRKTNNASSPSYCTWTTGGFVSNGEAQVFDPNDVIQTGQGFFVEASGNGTALEFNNDMRVDDHANQFFRAANTIERNRIWLNVTGAGGLFSQAMIGYITNATNEIDATDGKYINDGGVALTSLINETPYTIQGRSLPFDAADVVPMQFKATTAGTYTISIDHVDGLFSGSQDIYLRDAQTGLDHDLKSESYSFTTESGTFANRFSVVYTAALSIENPVLDANAIVVYKNENQSFTINSGSVTMSSVKVFDIRGRLLTTQDNINAAQTIITAGQANQVLLVQVTSIDGATVTKKVVR